MPTENGHTSAIRARKVIGTKVKNEAGVTVGEVEDIVLDKLSNDILFAVVSFGGYFGLGEKYHPLPWSALTYDKADGNYVVRISKEMLKDAPAYTMQDLVHQGTVFRNATYDYYKVPYYW